MNVILKPEAEETVSEICEFIDSVNTEDSGERWLDKLSAFLVSYAKSNVQYALCHNDSFAAAGLSCITYNGWVKAFRIEEDEFVVYQIVRGNILL